MLDRTCGARDELELVGATWLETGFEAVRPNGSSGLKTKKKPRGQGPVRDEERAPEGTRGVRPPPKLKFLAEPGRLSQGGLKAKPRRFPNSYVRRRIPN